jgi:hypothetical protein
VITGIVDTVRIVACQVASVFLCKASLNCIKSTVGSLLSILTITYALLLELDHFKPAKYCLKFYVVLLTIYVVVLIFLTKKNL